MIEVKAKVQSKTLWFNGLTSAASILTLLTGVVPPQFLPYALLAQGLINFGLRLVTTTALK